MLSFAMVFIRPNFHSFVCYVFRFSSSSSSSSSSSLFMRVFLLGWMMKSCFLHPKNVCDSFNCFFLQKTFCCSDSFIYVKRISNSILTDKKDLLKKKKRIKQKRKSTKKNVTHYCVCLSFFLSYYLFLFI